MGAVCVFVSFVASIPMSDAMMNRSGSKKMKLSLMFLIGWITLGVLSALDILTQTDMPPLIVWCLCLLGPVTIIMSQKILFGARKMGTLWEESGKPNFHPIVYNMGGPLFVWGWFMLWVATSGIQSFTSNSYLGNGLYPPLKANMFALGGPDGNVLYIPLFLSVR